MKKPLLLSFCFAFLGFCSAQSAGRTTKTTGVAVAIVPLVRAEGEFDLTNAITGSHRDRQDVETRHVDQQHVDVVLPATISLVTAGMSQTNESKDMKTNILVNKKNKVRNTKPNQKLRSKGKMIKNRNKSEKTQKSKQPKSQAKIEMRRKQIMEKLRDIKRKREKATKSKKRKAFIQTIRTAIDNIIDHVNNVAKTCNGTEQCNKVLRRKLFRLATIKPRAIAALAKDRKGKGKPKSIVGTEKHQKIKMTPKSPKRLPRLLERPRKKPSTLASLMTEAPELTTLPPIIPKTTPPQTTVASVAMKDDKRGKGGKRKQKIMKMKKLMAKRRKNKKDKKTNTNIEGTTMANTVRPSTNGLGKTSTVTL